MADRVRKVDYYYTTIANRAGQGARLLDSFRDEDVNFLAIHAFPAGSTAQVDFFPEDPRAFLRAAKKAGIKVSPRRTAFLVQGKDRVGAMARILEKLGDAKINVTATDGIAVGDRFGMLVWVRPDNVNRAARVLGARR
ncbi:MAG TPA: hypothetical protein VJP59_05780 [Gemmatimonadota bacterium]|nr:hypothetical protein [Gemmatimonadota bacterium]